MDFEYDETKSQANKAKHGIDFVEGQRLWQDPARLEREARSDQEPRRSVIGCLEGKHWTAIVTYRRAKIRLISVRRARTEEIAEYETHKR